MCAVKHLDDRVLVDRATNAKHAELYRGISAAKYVANMLEFGTGSVERVFREWNNNDGQVSDPASRRAAGSCRGATLCHLASWIRR